MKKKKTREELIQHRLKRAKETISEIEVYLKHNFLHSSANRIYYACFYAVSAALLSANIEAKTHTGIRNQFGKQFIQTNLLNKKFGRFYTEIFDYRHNADYDDYVDLEISQVRKILKEAKELVSEIEKLLSEKK